MIADQRAAIFVDGRYTLQVRSQVDTEALEPHHLIDMPPTKWIAESLPSGGKLGYDPWVDTENSIVALRKAARGGETRDDGTNGGHRFHEKIGANRTRGS